MDHFEKFKYIPYTQVTDYFGYFLDLWQSFRWPEGYLYTKFFMEFKSLSEGVLEVFEELYSESFDEYSNVLSEHFRVEAWS